MQSVGIKSDCQLQPPHLLLLLLLLLLRLSAVAGALCAALDFTR
jgi:hypothetical protein